MQKKTVEYRDFTEYNLKRMIGLKTVRFNRGYGAKGKPPKQMQWEVRKVVLLDGEDNACDPFDVPEDFWPVTIAVHLGKRIEGETNMKSLMKVVKKDITTLAVDAIVNAANPTFHVHLDGELFLRRNAARRGGLPRIFADSVAKCRVVKTYPLEFR